MIRRARKQGGGRTSQMEFLHPEPIPTRLLARPPVQRHFPRRGNSRFQLLLRPSSSSASLGATPKAPGKGKGRGKGKGSWSGQTSQLSIPDVPTPPPPPKAPPYNIWGAPQKMKGLMASVPRQDGESRQKWKSRAMQAIRQQRKGKQN